MTFAWPQLLWLLFIPLLLSLWDLLRHRKIATGRSLSKVVRAEAGARTLRVADASDTNTQRRRLRLWLSLGLTFCLLALARPQWGRIEEQVFDQSREILLALDLSKSMMAPDVQPSRLERSKLLIQVLLEKLKGERVGLAVFSGTAFLQCPLSSDYEILREFLPSLNSAFLPEGGTNYRALLKTATEAYSSTAGADRFLIILSDGEALDDDWKPLVEKLREKNVRIIALGIGTEAGSIIPDEAGGYVKDERGAVVKSKLEPATLRELAAATKGTYRDASAWVDLAGLLRETIEAARQGEFIEKRHWRPIERFQWFLAPGLLLLLVSFSLEFPVRIKPRHLGPAQPPPVLPTAAATERRPPPLPPRVASLILLAALLVLPANAQEKAKADGPSTPLGHAVQRISAKVELLAGDCKELAVQTIKWGETIKSSGQPIPDGPLRDGIDAVDAGALLNEKAADWGDLRRQLEALREKQDQKKDDQQQEKKDDEKKDQQQKQDKDQKQDQQKDQKDQKQEQKDSSKDKSQEKQDQKKEEPKDEKNSEQKEQQKQQDSAFGDMKKPDPQKQPPPPKPEEMQQIAPKDEKKEGEKIDPALAMPLEQLEKVKNNDAPGRLFQLMEGERKPGQQPANKKNW